MRRKNKRGKKRDKENWADIEKDQSLEFLEDMYRRGQLRKNKNSKIN